jgi:hypothetical protein
MLLAALVATLLVVDVVACETSNSVELAQGLEQ